MNEISRLLNLVPFISTHQGIGIGELAREFGVGEKDLKRDLMTLFMCGLPGYTPLELMEVDFENGYVTIRNADTLRKPRALTTEELCIAILGLSLLREIEPEQGERIGRLLDHLKEFVEIPIAFASDLSLTHSQTIMKAIHAQRQISFTYIASYSDEIKEHHVSPLDIFSQGAHQYLRGYSHTSQGLRTFDLARLSNLSISHLALEIFEDQEERLNIEINIRKRYRKFIEFFHSERFETFSDKWAVRAIVSAGGDVELKKPVEMRSLVAQRARSALAEYGALG